MRFRATIFAAILAATITLVVGSALAQDATQDTESAAVPGQIAPRLQTLGNLSHPITTRSPRAQLFFNQGLILSLGFNHREYVAARAAWNDKRDVLKDLPGT